MKKAILISVLLICVFLFSSCTSTSHLSLGGKTELDLPEGEKLLDISWQSSQDNLWILTAAREENEEPKTYYFYQWGGIIQSGCLTIKEH